MGHLMAELVNADMLFTPWLFARAPRVCGEVLPKKGQTEENRRSELTCIV